MKVFQFICLLLSAFTLTGCMTYTIGGPKGTSLRDIQPPRGNPIVHIGIPRSSHGIFNANEVKASIEATELFEQVIPDWKNKGARQTDGLYIDTQFAYQRNNKAYSVAWLAASFFTLGLIPIRYSDEFVITTTIYNNKKKIKTYRQPLTSARLLSVILPAHLLFGYSEERRDALFAVRYTTSLLSKMKKDGVIFKN